MIIFEQLFFSNIYSVWFEIAPKLNWKTFSRDLRWPYLLNMILNQTQFQDCTYVGDIRIIIFYSYIDVGDMLANVGDMFEMLMTSPVTNIKMSSTYILCHPYLKVTTDIIYVT